MTHSLPHFCLVHWSIEDNSVERIFHFVMSSSTSSQWIWMWTVNQFILCFVWRICSSFKMTLKRQLFTLVFFQCKWQVCVLFLSFSEDGMEVMERLIYLFRKFHQLKISNEEYACMKAINFLNQGNNTSSVITWPKCFLTRSVFSTWLLSFVSLQISEDCPTPPS